MAEIVTVKKSDDIRARAARNIENVPEPEVIKCFN
jgi:hypothetical protein